MLKPILRAYAARVRAQRLAYPDISEPALAPEFQRLLEDCFAILPVASGLAVIPEFRNPGVGRPDVALIRGGEPPRAFVELKHPSKPADPERWTNPHDRRQYARFQTLECWAASNFQAIHLFERDTEVAVATIVPKAALDPATGDAKADRLITGHDDGPFAAMLSRLAMAQAPSAGSAEELAANLAYAARLVRSIVAERIAELHAAGTTGHPLQQIRAEFRDVLYAHPEAGGYTGASFDDLFAAAFAQTLAFGLLLVREASGQPVGDNAWEHMPPEHPLLRSTLRVLSEPEVRGDIGIGWTVMLDTVNSFAAELLVPEPGGRDPILYFYEDFLAVFDPAARERYGVYYTPVEVVRFMTGALDRALRDQLGTAGLADRSVTLLDPAVGTGTFLLGVAERVRDQAVAVAGPGMAYPELLDLAGRMYGFELLIGPYAVAHYRLHHALRPPVAPGQPQPEPLPRLGIYLADTLARPGADAPIGALGFTAGGIREERLEANRIKAEQQVLAIIGNPPYRRLERGENETLVGRWMDDLWDDLKRTVRDAGWGGELNTFPELSVAFWRWAIWKLFEADNAPGRGVVAFITNRKFLTGRPYAGLRRTMRERFDRIEIIDLRGDGRRGERAGVLRDENVFDIMVGTAITIAIADGSRAGQDAEVRYTDVWNAGLTSRAAKLAWLNSQAERRDTTSTRLIDRNALANFRPEEAAFRSLVSLERAFDYKIGGMQTKRNAFVYDVSKLDLDRRIKRFHAIDSAAAAAEFRETRDRKADVAQAQPYDERNIVKVAFRPMDVRYLYNNRYFGDFLRPELQRVFGLNNTAIYTHKFGVGLGPALWAHSKLPD